MNSLKPAYGFVLLAGAVGLIGTGCRGDDVDASEESPVALHEQVENSAGDDWRCLIPGGNCRLPRCGNGIIDSWIKKDGTEVAEQCDDRNRRPGDGCSAQCTIEPGWTCESPWLPCRRLVCGDGRVDSYTTLSGISHQESCDDGNRRDRDGCDRHCATEPGWTCGIPGQPCYRSLCGNGLIEWYTDQNGSVHEENCDDGNRQNGDGCSSTCSIEPGWLCNTAGQNCRLPYCGDGLTESYIDNNGVSRAETCDDGNQVDNDACRNNCTPSRCGDGVVWAGVETCDDGNTLDGQGCSVACTDRCSMTKSDGCSASCQIQAGWVCQTPGQACCSNKCLEGDTQCSDARVQDCVMQANGCTDWTPPLDCPGNNSCIGADCRTGVTEPGLTIDAETSKTLDGNHAYDGDVIIQNSSVVTVPTGKLIIRAKRVVLDASSSIVVSPTGHDPRGFKPGGSGGYGTAGSATGRALSVNTCGGCRGLQTLCITVTDGGSSYAVADDEIASGATGTGATEYQSSCGEFANGGGYIAIFADVIQINGRISANGLESGSGGLVFLRATGDLTLSGNLSAAGGGGVSNIYVPPASSGDMNCTYYGQGGNGVVKLLYGSQHALTTSGVNGGVIFSSVIPPTNLLSPTHPQQDRWYNDEFDYADITWSKPFPEATGYYTRANTIHKFVPGPANGDLQPSESVRLVRSELAAETNYVHVTTVGTSNEVGTVESSRVINVNDSTPSISSTTHPSQSTWVDTNTPAFSWTLPHSPADTTNVYWILDQYPGTLPTVNDNKIPLDQAAPSASSSVQLPITANGIWFFHVRAQDTMGYLTRAAANYRIQVGPDPGTGTVSGTVTDSTTGTPLANAEVSLNRGMQTTHTDRAGQFVFNGNVYAQQYEIRAQLAGHLEGVQTINVAANLTTTVSLSLQYFDGALCSAEQTGLAPIAVATGANYTCMLLTGGTVECWGSNSSGQLGNGTTIDSLTPIIVSGLSGATAITTARSLECSNTCAVMTDGTVECWGANGGGQLGNGTTTDSLTPIAVSGLSGATAVAAGGVLPGVPNECHTCALLTGGTVECWGKNRIGELGNGMMMTDSLTPVEVFGLSSATAIAAGDAHTCALLTGETVECWGYNSEGQLGNHDLMDIYYYDEPVESFYGSSGATAVAAGGAHTCVLLTDGTVECWGSNDSGQLGDGTTYPHSYNWWNPTVISGLISATAITAGESHTCALLAGGTIACWGANSSGQLGNGTTIDSLTPIAVSGLSSATAIAAGESHTCALLTGGAIACWGSNSSGQLGDGTQNNALTPVAVRW